MNFVKSNKISCFYSLFQIRFLSKGTKTTKRTKRFFGVSRRQRSRSVPFAAGIVSTSTNIRPERPDTVTAPSFLQTDARRTGCARLRHCRFYTLPIRFLINASFSPDSICSKTWRKSSIISSAFSVSGVKTVRFPVSSKTPFS